MDGYESQRSIMVKVGIFTVTMLLVAVGLVVTFGEFRFGPSNTYHANFIDATRLKGGQKVRIAGVPVGAVKDVKLNPNNTVDVAFSVDKRYTLYSSTRAVIRYENLVGDRFLEITSGPGELRKLRAGRDHRPAATPSRRWTSTRCWVACARCSRAWMPTRSTRSAAT